MGPKAATKSNTASLLASALKSTASVAAKGPAVVPETKSQAGNDSPATAADRIVEEVLSDDWPGNKLLEKLRARTAPPQYPDRKEECQKAGHVSVDRTMDGSSALNPLPTKIAHLSSAKASGAPPEYRHETVDYGDGNGKEDVKQPKDNRSGDEKDAAPPSTHSSAAAASAVRRASVQSQLVDHCFERLDLDEQGMLIEEDSAILTRLPDP